jgi:acyl carrier protein
VSSEQGLAAVTSGSGVPDTSARVRTFITTNFYVADPQSLGEEASLLDGGIIDSTGVLEVVQFLEEQFGIAIADDELLPENLDSIGNIARFILRKRQG